MKILDLHALKEEDLLRFTFEGTLDPRTEPEHELMPFLQALEQHAGEWMPDVVEGKRRRKYSRSAFWKSFEETLDEGSTVIGLYRTKWPALDMSLSITYPPLVPGFDISMAVHPLSFFAQEERCREFVDMVRTWASCYPVIQSSAHSIADKVLTGAPSFGREQQIWLRDGFDKIYEVFWLNVFSSKLVESVGRERIRSTPAWRLEELPDGAILLVTRPTPVDFASHEAREAQALAHVHLRPDLDLDTVRRTLEERSALFVPVEPRFHPDLAPLLSRVVDLAGISQRQRRTAELNAWQPPEPEEWLPLDTALPEDVEDPVRAREHYSSLAEHLVALMHSQVPSVLAATPESLTDIDFYFWREDFPKTRLREAIDAHAVPAIGAYLGEALVRHLGGTWMARQNLMEAQVRVGERVWLPFVRARDYMRSRQTLLDFSLTRLYREAERHRS